MDVRLDRLDPLLARVGALLTSTAPSLPPHRRSAVERWRGDADALRFHLANVSGPTVAGATGERPPILVILGGTGTGKSTLVNRLTGRNVSASSFRRTFTSAPVAIARRAADVPPGWLGVEHVVAAPQDLPARGRPGALVIVETLAAISTPPNVGVTPASPVLVGATPASPAPSTNHLIGGPDVAPTLVDTPDLDGDQPAHHAQADRAFRWAQAVLFLVTPEKYQMTELLPYYRLARRYAVPALYVMNKCEEQAVLDDYARQLEGASEGSGFRVQSSGKTEPASSPSAPRVFAIARDDAAYEPPAEMNLSALRSALASFPLTDETSRRLGLQNRAGDVLGRFTDQVLSPLRDDRREADRMAAALRALVTPEAGVDVNPLTQQLQRRLQQRSILYLMGPQRMLDRVRQAPTLLARLPRVAWDYLRSGEMSPELLNPAGGPRDQQVPDFRAMLTDQFTVLQSRIDDVLRSSPTGQKWLDPNDDPVSAGGVASVTMSPANPSESGNGARPADRYAVACIDPAEAGKIADEELADLTAWLEQKWNATPRDTRMLETLLRYLPGGRRLSRWTEAAPYLLTVVLITHGAVFGHIDLLVLGGYGLATWLSERLSNEVTNRTRATNTRIEQRFADLAHEQIERVCAWLDKQAPGKRTLEQLERIADEMHVIATVE